MTEEQIISAIRSSKQDGAELLIRRYGALMRYIIAPIVSNPQDREECLVEATMRAWQKIHQYDPERGSWTAWLTAVTRNAALNYVRTARNPDTAELTPDLPSPDPTPEERVLQKERQQELMRAIGQLSSFEQQLFYRKYYYLQSTAQIARETGMTERAVEGRLYRIRQWLRKLLGGDMHG